MKSRNLDIDMNTQRMSCEGKGTDGRDVLHFKEHQRLPEKGHKLHGKHEKVSHTALRRNQTCQNLNVDLLYWLRHTVYVTFVMAVKPCTTIILTFPVRK